MAKKSAQLAREIRDVLAHCPDCGRPFDARTRRHTLDPYVNRFLIPTCCASDYGSANPAWKPTRPVRAAHATAADVFSPHPRQASRAVRDEKLADLRQRFPVGSYVKGTRFAFKDQLAKVTSYDTGYDDAPLVKIRFVRPIDMGTHMAKTAKLGDEEIKAVSKQELEGDKLLARFRALDEKRAQAARDLDEAARQADRVTIADEEGTPVDAATRKATRARWAKTVRAEKAITTKMRDLVIKIRAIDPARVPWAWRNTR